MGDEASPKQTNCFAFILVRYPKIASGAFALILAIFDRGHSSRSLFPAPRAVAFVPSQGKGDHRRWGMRRGVLHSFSRGRKAKVRK